jgi:glutathione S-transferase
MKLYYAPGVCSIGIHVLLEEIGKPYDLQLVNLREQAQYQPPFTAVNPKSKVPTLERDDGSILTEFSAIATYLAKSNPQSKLIPQDLETEVRAMEAMEYVVGTMHAQAFSRIFRPDKYGPADQEEQVKAHGREMFDQGFAILDKTFAAKNYLGGHDLSIADAAVFYIEFWAAGYLGMKLPVNVAAHYERMKSRPAVQRVMQQEGVA